MIVTLLLLILRYGFRSTKEKTSNHIMRYEASLSFRSTLKDKRSHLAVLQKILGRHGSASLCRVERENKMAATYMY